MKKKVLVYLASNFLLTSSLFSQALKTDSILDLDEVVVTGTRSEKLLREIPARIDVVSPKILKQAPAQSIDDILAMFSGVNTTRSSGVSTMHTNVSIRGLAGDEQGRTLVLYDGVPINSSDGGSVNWNSIHIDNVERIEIFKGPGSSLYGNNAMGGVINIISKKATKPLNINASSSYGTYNTWLTNLSVSSRVSDKVSLFVSGYYNQSDGYNLVPDSLRPDPDYTIPRFMKEGGANLLTQFSLSQQANIDIAYELFLDKRGEGEKIEAPDGEYRHFNHNRVRGRFYGEYKKLRYDFSLYFQRVNYFKLDERIKKGKYQRFDVKSDRDDWGGILNFNYNVSSTNDLTYGLELRNGAVEGGDYYVTSPDVVYNRGKMRIFSIYAQDEQTILDDKLKLQVAVRYDNARFHDGFYEAKGDLVADFNSHNGALKSNTWNNFSPRIALRYTPEKWGSFYASFSKGFRASILDDLCRSGWMWVGPKIANPDLKPETLYNYEVGATFTPLYNLSIAPTFYYAQGHDFLYYVATGEKLWGRQDIYQRQNVSRVNVKGIEMDIRYTPIRGLDVVANYSFNDAQIDKFPDKPELDGKTLTYAPKHQVKGSLNWTGGIVDAYIRGAYKGKQFTTDNNAEQIDAYTVWDARISKWFNQLYYVGFEVLNIFDNRHMNTKDYISSGRIFQVKLAISLSK